ncbi:MAG TPA: hypothetical protein VH062_14700 [Polyangiaceae bacterium]|nr:hypothetical protein [Polyangiaceae bacterium]
MAASVSGCAAFGCGNAGSTHAFPGIGEPAAPPEDAGETDSGAFTWQPGHADACAHPIHSGFANDELCLDPPPESEGFQLHFGPLDYDDPDDIKPFVVDPGGEEVLCENMTSPNTSDRYYIEYHAHLRTGTHHMITYASFTNPTVPPDGTVQPCGGNDPSFHFIIGSQAALGANGGSLDVPLPGKVAPEDEGLAAKLPAASKIVVEMHYVNTGTTQLLAEGWTNILYTPVEQVKGILDPIYFIGGLGENTPAHASETITAQGCGLTDAQGDSLRIVGMTGHTHAMSTQFRAYVDRQTPDPGAAAHQLIYQSYDWQEPLNAEFNSVKQNQILGAIPGTDGAASGDLILKRGDTLSWECDVTNNTDTALRFANEAYTAEMCNVFGFVTPGTGQPWSCFKF